MIEVQPFRQLTAVLAHPQQQLALDVVEGESLLRIVLQPERTHARRRVNPIASARWRGGFDGGQ